MKIAAIMLMHAVPSVAVLAALSARAEPPPVIMPLVVTPHRDPLQHGIARKASEPAALAPVPWCAPSPEDAVRLAPEPMVPDLLGVLLEGAASEAESKLVTRAIDTCTKATRATTDAFELLALLRLEVALGVPDRYRGISLAVLCVEASMRNATHEGGPLRGDWRHGVARAHGPFQLHDWFRAWCGAKGAEADDLVWAAGCYLARVAYRVDQPLTNCPGQTWRVAEALAANGPRYAPQGCAARSRHWAAWEAMR